MLVPQGLITGFYGIFVCFVVLIDFMSRSYLLLWTSRNIKIVWFLTLLKIMLEGQKCRNHTTANLKSWLNLFLQPNFIQMKDTTTTDTQLFKHKWQCPYLTNNRISVGRTWYSILDFSTSLNKNNIFFVITNNFMCLYLLFQISNFMLHFCPSDMSFRHTNPTFSPPYLHFTTNNKQKNLVRNRCVANQSIWKVEQLAVPVPVWEHRQKSFF